MRKFYVILIAFMMSVMCAPFSSVYAESSFSGILPSRTLTNNLQDVIVSKQYQEITDISGTHSWWGGDITNDNGLEYVDFMSYAKSQDQSGNIYYDTYDLYDYIEHDHIQFTFLDGQSHSGVLNYTVTGTGRSFISDNPNVQVYNNKIYFYNCSTVDVYTTSYYLGQNTVSVHSTYFKVTLSSITYPEFHDVNDMYTLFTENGGIIADIDEIKISSQSTATRLQSALTKLDNITNVLSGISSTLGLTYNEIVEQGLTLDQISTSLSSLEEYITTFHSFDIPEESFNLAWSFFKRNINVLSISNNMYWNKYPIFDMKSGNYVNFIINANSVRYLILGVNINSSNSSNFLSFFSLSEGVTITSFTNIKSSLPQFRFIRLVLRNSTDSNINNALTALSDINVIPIYFGDGSYLSTSFMEKWFPPDTSNIDDSTSSLTDASSDLADLEDGITSDMQESLTDLDTDIDFLNNPDFISSGNFVKTMFNNLVVNTQLGSLLIAFLVLGIASLFIGRNK